MQPVVDEIVRYGQKFNIGMEAGSKPELHAVLGMTENPDTIIVCNGYKDKDFIELALLATQMGKKIFIRINSFFWFFKFKFMISEGINLINLLRHYTMQTTKIQKET